MDIDKGGKPTIEYTCDAVLFIGDPHVAAYPPGHRIDDYKQTVLEKLEFLLETAAKKNALPVILGDLFHVPRDNPNSLLVSLIELFSPHKPWVLVGNHDKHEARFTKDVSLAVLAASGAIRLIDSPGVAATLIVENKRVLLGASPDWTPIPKKVERNGYDFVVWITHHNIAFPGYEAGKVRLRPVPGVDMIVNGHIHTPKEPVRIQDTLWLNPGSIVRITRSKYTREQKPAALLWRPARDTLESIPVPCKPFSKVFLSESDSWEQGFIPDESRFIKGLENLALKRTTEGVGLKAFLEQNLDPESKVDQIIWELYEEVIKSEQSS